ncbi:MULTISPECIES: hypothetical protein [Flavobacterium]|uniref:Uncharacterized protein n=1 Tax=Flavobacterium orientale TaxID=1756020 RepID=A0A916Y8R7_9FLAO|nr:MULTISPECIES: hypothetical protein [Flavobacterium]GGD35003.1 hypothetical protein GCM10011343_26070 [Flavobacterium orientale]
MSDFKLDNHPKINPGFKTPEGYFDALPEKILLKLEQQPKVIPFYKKAVFQLVAAVLLLAVLLPIGIKTLPFSTSDEINSEAIEHYLSYTSDMYSYDLLSLLSEEEVKNMEVDYEIEPSALENTLLQNSNIDIYLLD